MKLCAELKMISLLVILTMKEGVNAFVVSTHHLSRKMDSSSLLKALPEKVEVCGFKDCRRAGGGARLEKLINSVLEENELQDKVKVEGCDCQGECGYGPNLLVDGKIVNSVKGKEAVEKALGIECATNVKIHNLGRHDTNTHTMSTASPTIPTLERRFTSFKHCMTDSSDTGDSDKNEHDDDKIDKEQTENNEKQRDEDLINSNQEEPAVLQDLDWRVEKLRLEEANTRRFLKAGPRFLPYEECRKWVKAWNRWESEEEWVRWIDDGEKRNSYIPARPDEYYGKRGDWKGWDHFLGVEVEKKENVEDIDDHNDPDLGFQ